MNRLERTLKRLEGYPVWLRSWFIGRVVKLTGTTGIRYEVMEKNRVIVSLKNRLKVRNHIGQIHAAAMILLAETATGMVVGMNIPDDKIPLVKALDVQFVRRSQGAMKAEARLEEAQIQAIQSLEKGTLEVAVRVTDETGEEPIICKATWAWISK